jgi:hypothetical protein
LDWVLAGGSFSDLILVPWQWIDQGPAPVRKLAAIWYLRSPAQLGIVPGSYWEIEAISDRSRGMVRHPVGESYLFATNNEKAWELVLSNAKAAAFLKTGGYIQKNSLDASIIETNRYNGVFRDWLSIGARCAWVHSGESLPSDLLRVRR